MKDDLEITHQLLAAATGSISLMLARRRARSANLVLCKQQIEKAQVHLARVLELLKQHGK